METPFCTLSYSTLAERERERERKKEREREREKEREREGEGGGKRDKDRRTDRQRYRLNKKNRSFHLFWNQTTKIEEHNNECHITRSLGMVSVSN